MRYLFSLVLVMFITQLSAQFTKGKYVNIQDTCHSITFLDSNQVIKTNRCFEEGVEEILYDFENNIERDLKKDPYTYYKIEDYIDSKKEYIVNFYYSDGIFSNRLSIINKGNHLVVTGLKGLPGIMNHYAFSSFFVHKDSLQNFKTPKEPREIIVVDSSMVNVNYDLLIAYGQEVGGINDTIYIDSCCVKTQKIANPEILAYHNYDVFLKMGNKLKSIPVFEDFDDAEEFFKDKKGDKIFAKIYRFNPSRDDVVNTLFKEEIEGQVLIVKVYTVKYYKDRYIYLLLNE